MVKKSMLLSIVILLTFTGCSKRELVIPQGSGGDIATTSSDNTWANETNVEENVDISDIDSSVGTEESTVSVGNQTNAKMERVPFPVSEYKHLARTGKGTVKGMIYLKDAYEKGIPGRSTRLYLNPITSYSKQWYNESYLGGYKMQKADNRLFNYLRFTASDNDGKFAFYGVPSGRYYLIGTVKCGSECGYSVPKNVRIATQVSVSGNQVVEKNLTRLVD